MQEDNSKDADPEPSSTPDGIETGQTQNTPSEQSPAPSSSENPDDAGTGQTQNIPPESPYFDSQHLLPRGPLSPEAQKASDTSKAILNFAKDQVETSALGTAIAHATGIASGPAGIAANALDMSSDQMPSSKSPATPDPDDVRLQTDPDYEAKVVGNMQNQGEDASSAEMQTDNEEAADQQRTNEVNQYLPSAHPSNTNAETEPEK
jgi:hypothetical protein